MTELLRYVGLGNIIEFLEKYPREQVVVLGWGEPHSYRGYYDQLAFDPVKETYVGSMLDHCLAAVGKEFQGYKGGYYKMDELTECWIAYSYESGGQLISDILLRYMVDDFEGVEV